MQNHQDMIILAGPTAVGKTQYALKKAHEWDAEILSCDAMQFYRGLDIGTAKPTPEEQAQIAHHGVDIRELRHPMDIQSYTTYAKEVVSSLHKKGKNVLVVGGSGLYQKSFLEPVTDPIKVSPDTRQRVQKEYDDNGLESLVNWLHELNPDGLAHLDTNNPRRVIRALERCLASGKTHQQQKTEMQEQPRPFPACTKHLICLEREDHDLRHRIHLRTKKMLKNGLIEEVNHLMQNDLLKNPSAANAIGYAEVIEWLKDQNGDIEKAHSNRDVLQQCIEQSTWKLVRKQRTWIRNQLHPDQWIYLTTEGTP